MRPGVNVAAQTQAPNTAAPVNTGTWFVAGVTSQGPSSPQNISSFQQFQQVYGGRGTIASLLSDSLEVFFSRGGASAWIARVVGPGAATASIALLDGSSGPSCTVKAIGPGTYANGYKIVIAGSAGSYTITVQDSNSVTLEASGTLTSLADAVSYGQTSSYVTVTATGTLSPAAGTFTLASGLDDLSSITTTQYTNALALFTADKGPGQVSVPGVTTNAVNAAVTAHANAFGRVAFLDLADTVTAATLTTAAATVTALGTGSRVAAFFAPWVDIAPLPGGIGFRAVPASAFAAAAYASVDSRGNPNQAAAGLNGTLTGVQQVHATFTDAERQTLNLAGVNVIRAMGNGFRLYGARTATAQTDDLYVWLPNVRLDMAISAEALAIGETYEFDQIDGQGIEAKRFGNSLSAMLLKYFALGALFGDTPEHAFRVDTGSDINTPITANLEELLAVIAVRRSKGAEQVNINVVRVPITQAV